MDYYNVAYSGNATQVWGFSHCIVNVKHIPLYARTSELTCKPDNAENDDILRKSLCCESVVDPRLVVPSDDTRLALR